MVIAFEEQKKLSKTMFNDTIVNAANRESILIRVFVKILSANITFGFPSAWIYNPINLNVNSTQQKFHRRK